ncbi:Uncharacterized membrane protein, DUF4010 family [Desulfurobacterium pacificum]|uniref:Uncharacterized membrane protein, DUF4010 family n=1 Tax=Desulfurobacterium pacificum TaxID=240166 RepID=A0ABY1NIK1_9BACT|nr:MgtC/SapB family protein [Desulfurobacterium pacificum]SMP10391.1 Uncharacterized membrane protein, DUF4010 family [Desulfurobacterium pacificum]
MVESAVWKAYEPYLVSLIIGGLIGVEREYKKQKEGVPSFGGVRTFMLISLLGTLCAHLSKQYEFFLYLGFFVTAVLLMGAQLVEKSPRLTSSFSALITFLLGAMCSEGQLQVAAAIAVSVLFVLSFKEQMHDFVRHLTMEDLFAFLKFAVVTVIIYPLLPDKNFYGVNPKEVWTMVAVISTIDFIGYVLTKVAGEKGVLLTGLIGGLVSSTAVTVTFSPLAKTNPLFINEYAAGIVGASAIMFPRMTFLAGVVSPHFAMYLLIPSLVAFVGGIFWAYKISTSKNTGRTNIEVKNPYELSTAIKFGIFYAFILFVSRNALKYFGDFGLYVVAAISGLSDVDAITLSTAKLFSSKDVTLLAGIVAVLIAATVNTVFKWFLTLSMGNRELFRKVTPGFMALIIGEIIGIALLFFIK